MAELKPVGVDVFAYHDFRDFLKDYYRERRRRDRKFSIRFFARKAGLKSQNYLKVVMDGRRSLTPRNVPKFVKGLGLDIGQAEYFDALVKLNQARDLTEKQECLERVLHLQKKKRAVTIAVSQMEFFTTWYNIVIYEMASQENFNPDPQIISRRLGGKVSPEQVQASLDLLRKLGILKFDSSGLLQSPAAQVISSEDLPKEKLSEMHQTFVNQALERIRSSDPEDSLIRCLTIALTKDQVPVFKAKIREFAREMNTLFSTGKGTDIFQLNLQFFKLTDSE